MTQGGCSIGFPTHQNRVQILVSEIWIFCVHQDNEVEIGSICHLINDTLEGLCNSEHCDHHDWFQC